MSDTIYYFRDSALPQQISGISGTITRPLCEGLAGEMIVEIVYGPGREPRQIFPEVIFRYLDVWYVAAYCMCRDEARTFRLDRISSAVLTDQHDTTYGVAENYRQNGVPWASDELEAKHAVWKKIENLPFDHVPEYRERRDVDEELRDRNLVNQLISYTEQGDIARMEELIALGADVNGYGGTGDCPVIAAAAGGDLSVLLLLMRHGADPMKKSKGGETALVAASRKNGMDVVRFLVEKCRADINEKGAGWTPLMAAVARENTDLAEYYLSRGADVARRDREGNTAFLVTARFADEGKAVPLLRLLLDHGADINDCDKQKRNALMLLPLREVTGTVGFLVEKGISLTARDRKGKSVFHYVMQSIEKIYLWDELELSVRERIVRQHREMILFLVRHGANINAADRDGVTPLMMAKPEILSFMLQCGANPNAFDETGKTVLMYHCSDMESIDLLVEYGADPAARNDAGEDLLLVAPCEYDLICPLIQKYGFSVNDRRKDGISILHRACLYEDLKLVCFLLENGADPAAGDWQGRTALDLLDAADDEFIESDDVWMIRWCLVNGSTDIRKARQEMIRIFGESTEY